MNFENENLRIEYEGNVLKAFIKGEIDHHSSKTVREIIDKEIKDKSPEKVILDLSGITFTDSSGLGLIMGRYRLLENTSIGLTVQNVPDRVMAIFNMAGLERIINFN